MSTIRLTHTICPYPQSGYNLFRDTRKVSKYLGNFLKKIITETFQNTRIWSHWWCDGSSARRGTARRGTARRGTARRGTAYNFNNCVHTFFEESIRPKWFAKFWKLNDFWSKKCFRPFRFVTFHNYITYILKYVKWLLYVKDLPSAVGWVEGPRAFVTLKKSHGCLKTVPLLNGIRTQAGGGW